MRQVLIGIIAMCAAALPAQAEMPNLNDLMKKGAQAVLEATDARHYGYQTQKWVFSMKLIPKAGASRTVRFSTWQKRQKRLVRFLAPGDVKGMSVLVVNRNTMYVYSPQTDNVRRVAAHARRQTFMGSDLTFDDMSQVGLSGDFSAAFGKKTGDYIWLKLTRKQGSESQWPKLRIRVDKKRLLVDKIEYNNGKKTVKTQ